MPETPLSPSLYEILYGNFDGGLPLDAVSEENQVILSVLDNMQRILNTRAGSLKHLPDYGLPDLTKILQGMPGTAHVLVALCGSRRALSGGAAPDTYYHGAGAP